MDINSLLNLPFSIDSESLIRRAEDLRLKQENLIIYPFQKEITIKHLDYWGVNSVEIDDKVVNRDSNGFFKIKNLSRFKKYKIKMSLNFNMATISKDELINILSYKVSQIAQEALKDKELNQTLEIQEILKKFVYISNHDILKIKSNDILSFLNVFKNIDDNYEMFYSPFESLLKSEISKSISKLEKSRDLIDFVDIHFLYMSIVNLYRREYLLVGLTV